MERQRSRDLLIVTVFIVAAAVSLLGIGRLKVDSSTDAFIPAKAPVVETNNRIEEQFGSLDALVVSLYDEGGIINKENLAVIDSLTRNQTGQFHHQPQAPQALGGWSGCGSPL
jgi:hypothetical protein